MIETKKCKYCNMVIDKNSKICPHCNKKQNRWKGFLIILLSIYVVAFFGSLVPEETSEEENTIKIENSLPSQTPPQASVAVNKKEEIVEKTLLYDENNVNIYIKDIEERNTYYVFNIYIENNSDLNLNFCARSYAINRINTDNNIYDMSCDVANGKKANGKIEIRKDFLSRFGINEIKSFDVLFWAYDNDKNYKSFDTGQIEIKTSLFNGDFEEISGECIFEKHGIRIDYLYNSGNKYTYCLTNNTGNYLNLSSLK